ncbi:hypothetical protein AAG570_012419 [Ranatra chinensis]|uniref:RNA-directed DNA polymerase n=1 Tax=Ranatra chinensis TaxID=642074 RepID=A0ABD0Z519_9HEMI
MSMHGLRRRKSMQQIVSRMRRLQWEIENEHSAYTKLTKCHNIANDLFCEKLLTADEGSGLENTVQDVPEDQNLTKARDSRLNPKVSPAPLVGAEMLNATWGLPSVLLDEKGSSLGAPGYVLLVSTVDGAFRIITDHAALKWLNNLKNPMGQLARWGLKLQEYPFEVVHRAGRLHAAPDALSRDTAETSFYIGVEGTKLEGWYREMIEKVEAKPIEYPQWKVEGGALWTRVAWKDDNPCNLVVPKEKRAEVMRENHDAPTVAHLGNFKTRCRILERYNWPGMRTDIAKYVVKCPICLETKPDGNTVKGLMGKQDIGFALRTAVNESTGYAPNFLNFGRQLKTSAAEYRKDRTGEPIDDTRDNLVTRLKELEANRMEALENQKYRI